MTPLNIAGADDLEPKSGQFGTEPSLYLRAGDINDIQLGSLTRRQANGKLKTTIRLVVPCAPEEANAACCNPKAKPAGTVVLLSFNSDACATDLERTSALNILKIALGSDSIKNSILGVPEQQGEISAPPIL